MSEKRDERKTKVTTVIPFYFLIFSLASLRFCIFFLTSHLLAFRNKMSTLKKQMTSFNFLSRKLIPPLSSLLTRTFHSQILFSLLVALVESLYLGG
jgi:hypothetical protein